MSEALTIGEIRRWLGNPIVRAVLNKSIEKEDQGKPLIEAAMEHLVFGTRCRLTSKFYSWLIGVLIRRSAEIFGVDAGEVLEALKEPFFRRGIRNTLEGIAQFGVQTPQTTAAPFLVVWQFTNACNLKCKHCYANATPKPKPDELTTEESKDLIDEMAEDGVVAIAFSGGEPLMRKDFFEVACYAKKKEFYVAIATNGTVITPKIAKKLKNCVHYVEVSIDGMEKTHDDFRGIPGVFNRSVIGIKNCVNEGLDVGIAPTITRYNRKEIPELLELARKLKVNRFIAFNFIPTGRGKSIVDKDLTPEEREKTLKFLYSKLLEKGYPDVLSTAPEYSRISIKTARGDPDAPVLPTHFAGEQARDALKGKTKTLSSFIGGCGAGRIYCSIQPDGDVWPCVFLPIKVGSIRESRLKDIWMNSPIFRELRDRSKLKGFCKVCPFRNVCGGCRARAYGYFKDIQAPDPGCIYNKKYWEEAKSAEVEFNDPQSMRAPIFIT